jgi:adenosine deaminase
MGSLDEMRLYMHEVLYPHINNRQGFEFTAEQALRESVLDGVKTLEMSLDVKFMRCYPSRGTGFFDFIAALVARYSSDVDFRPEAGVSKDRPPSDEIPLAVECIETGMFKSIDLYGNEEAQPPEAYTGLYQRAGRSGLKLKAHVGEFGDASLVERTVRVLDLREVQHGVAAAASESVMAFLRKEGVRLNVCPGSNVALSVAASLSDHPIKALVSNGVRVSINSDDKTIFGRCVSEEYLALWRNGTLSEAELEEIRTDSLKD